jgi:hypothetical protein
MRTIKAMLLALVLASLSLTGAVNESFAGVTTPAAVAPAVSSSDHAMVDQVQWRRGWGGYGWRGRGWGGYGWRGRGYGWGGGYGYGGGCWRWRYGYRVLVC